jgi:hypothetical protein
MLLFRQRKSVTMSSDMLPYGVAVVGAGGRSWVIVVVVEVSEAKWSEVKSMKRT